MPMSDPTGDPGTLGKLAQMLMGIFGGGAKPAPGPTPAPPPADKPWEDPSLKAPVAMPSPAAATPSPGPYTYQQVDPIEMAQRLEAQRRLVQRMTTPIANAIPGQTGQ